jgi:hypothetical protein
MVVQICNSNYLGIRGRRMESSRPAQAKLARPDFKNKRDEGCGSSGKALA